MPWDSRAEEEEHESRYKNNDQSDPSPPTIHRKLNPKLDSPQGKANLDHEVSLQFPYISQS